MTALRVRHQVSAAFIQDRLWPAELSCRASEKCCVAEMGGLKPESDPKESFAFEGANVGYEVNRPLERFGRDVKG